ncbi:MAG: PTS sugar transporter subunit IIC [bacterium]|nr:PTS sugar transporter subunit IIC [bacterium]
MITTLLFISLLGSFLSLDNSLVGNIMVSRPIVVGPLIGLIIGDLNLGIEIGFLMEFLWADLLYAGTAIPINLTLFTTIILGASYILPHYDESFTMFIILLTIPMIFICRQIEIGLRLFNSFIANKLEVLIIRNKQYKRVYFSLFHGLFIFVFVNFILIFVCITLTSQLAKILYLRLDIKFIKALSLTYNALPIIGFFVLLHIFTHNFKTVFRNLFNKN